MATNLSIDPELIEQALQVSGERTKKAAVTRALEEFIARRRQKGLLEILQQLTTRENVLLSRESPKSSLFLFRCDVHIWLGNEGQSREVAAISGV